MITWIVLIILFVLLLILYFKFIKIPKMKNIIFIDGSLGTGKTALSVMFAVRLYRKQVRIYYIKKFFLRFIFRFGRFKGKWKTLEKPILYSNLKLKHVPFVLLNKDILQRKNYRFAYKSVVLIDEISLLADQMDYDDAELSELLSEFFKLFRHESKGGYCIINSQSCSDLHYSLKYVLSDYFYIHSKSRLIGFSLLKVQECRYSSDQSSIQINSGDIEDNLKLLVLFSKYFKYYDTYAYSCFTDHLPVLNDTLLYGKRDSLKNPDILTFKKDYDDPEVIALKQKNKRVRCSYIKRNLKERGDCNEAKQKNA